MDVSVRTASEGFLYVPRNATGMRSLDYNIDDSINVAEWKLTSSENLSLAETYYAINKNLGTMIDYCEDETIPNRSIQAAIEVVSRKATSATNGEQKSALCKLKEALELAAECGTCVWLFI